MASISTNQKTGRRIILFTGLEGRRQSIRFGAINKRQADTAKLHIEDLLTSRIAGTAPKDTTSQWLAGLPDTFRKRLERVGLTGPRRRRACPTLGAWLESYFVGRSDVKESTTIAWGHTRRNLLAFFGPSKRLDEITPADADAFRIDLKASEPLAENTRRRRMSIAGQFFRAAVRAKLITENPFDGQKTTLLKTTARDYFVTGAEAQAVLDACPDPQWRLIFALCRYGGLRCPTEVLRLQWQDIDWANSIMVVHAAKTEHHEGGGVRRVPIFPEILPHLRQVFEEAAPGTERVITRYREASANLRTQLARIIKRAGLESWPKLFQNCRASRETELAETFPLHVTCAWLGHTPKVAMKNYLQVTAEHFEKATQKATHFPAQYPTATGCTDSQAEPSQEQKPPFLQDYAKPCDSMQNHLVGATGLEPVTSSV